MNEESLKAELQKFYDKYEDIGIAIYAIFKDSLNSEPKKIDIEGDALKGLKALFIQSLKDSISNKDGFSVLNLSTSDERANAIYLYDIEIPEDLKAMELVVTSDNLPLMDLKELNLSGIKALLIEIGDNENQMVLYKTMAPVNIFGRKSFFLKKAKYRLEKIKNEFLRVSSGFQLLRINDNLLVLDLTSIERSFGFHDIIKREALLGIDSIEQIQIIENPTVLHELINDVKYARRFTRIAKSSPVLKAKVPNDSIINFCKTFPKLVGKIRFNSKEDKILLDTNVSKDLFIKLLMDDFLTSELTSFHYASVAKDRADEEVS